MLSPNRCDEFFEPFTHSIEAEEGSFEVLHNAIGWFEIYVQDLELAKNFYEGVLDVRLERLADRISRSGPSRPRRAPWAPQGLS